MRAALRPTLFSLSLLLIATNGAWGAKGPEVIVEAHVGAAVIVFQNIECPDVVYDVATGEMAVTDPETCDTVVQLSTVPDDIADIAWAIANDPDALDNLAEDLADLTDGELALLATVLQNNQQHLGTDDQTTIDFVAKIAEVNPEGAAVVVLTATVLNPSAAEAILAAAVASSPGYVQPFTDASNEGLGIGDELTPLSDDGAPPGGDGTTDDVGEEGEQGDDNVEVRSVEDADDGQAPEEDNTPPGGPSSNTGDNTVPPGGGDIPGPQSPE